MCVLLLLVFLAALLTLKTLQCVVDTLMTRREMLEEYFSLSINAEGMVQSLPMLLRDYTPNLDKLPLFLMRLGPQVFDPIRSQVMN